MPRGGPRPGSGRKPGSYSQKTLDAMKVKAAIQQRILQHADSLLNSQMGLGKGVMHVYRVEETGEGKNKKREHVLVTDPDEIKEVLDENEGASGLVDDTYYVVSTKDPNNFALDSLFNRGLGKVTDKIDVTSGGEPIGLNDEQYKQFISRASSRGGDKKGGN